MWRRWPSEILLQPNFLMASKTLRSTDGSSGSKEFTMGVWPRGPSLRTSPLRLMTSRGIFFLRQSGVPSSSQSHLELIHQMEISEMLLVCSARRVGNRQGRNQSSGISSFILPSVDCEQENEIHRADPRFELHTFRRHSKFSTFEDNVRSHDLLLVIVSVDSAWARCFAKSVSSETYLQGPNCYRSRPKTTSRHCKKSGHCPNTQDKHFKLRCEFFLFLQKFKIIRTLGKP